MKTVLDLYREHCPGVKLKTKGPREWAGPCPECGGNDRFILQPDNPRGTGGRFFCRGCGKQGDAVTFVREFTDRGMTYRQACESLGTEPKPGYAGRGNGWNMTRQKREHTNTGTSPETWVPRAASLPPARWMRQAATFTAHCVRAAVETEAGREALTARGLTLETARALAIGWNSRDRYDSRRAWGLPEEVNPDTGKPRKIWLPKGLIVPFRRKAGIAGLFVRRMPWTPGDKLPKCCQVKGGTDGAYCSGPAGMPVVIVESIIDACLIRQEAGDLVSAVALTGATKRPDADTAAFLRKAPLLLWAMDNDKAGAGQWPWWQENFPVSPWPVPGGKDPGDYLQAGGSIRRWLEIGLQYAGTDLAEVLQGVATTDTLRAGTSMPEPSPLPSPETAASTHEKAPDSPSDSTARERQGNTQPPGEDTATGHTDGPDGPAQEQAIPSPLPSSQRAEQAPETAATDKPETRGETLLRLLEHARRESLLLTEVDGGCLETRFTGMSACPRCLDIVCNMNRHFLLDFLQAYAQRTGKARSWQYSAGSMGIAREIAAAWDRESEQAPTAAGESARCM